MSLKNILGNTFLWPWLVGMLIGLAFCSNYLLMFTFRQIWQSHYPALASQWSNNGPFTVVGFYGTELFAEELAYATRAKEASERLLAFDPFIKENRSMRLFVMELLVYTPMGIIQALVGNISWTWILIRFICCVFWTVLIFHLARRMGGSPHFALFCAVFVCCFSYWLTLLFRHNLIWEGGLFKILTHNAWTLLSYGRTEGVFRLPRPGVINSYSYLAALWGIKAAEGRGWKWTVLSGVMGGALAYVRLDVWTTYLVAAYLFAFIHSVKHGLNQKLFASAALSTLLSLPYLYFHYPPERELMVRIGIIFQRTFDPQSIPYLLAFLIGWRYKSKPADLMLAAIGGSMFIMVNIELVTGYMMFSEHWKFLGNIYLFLQVLSFLPDRIKELKTPWLAGCAAAILAVFMQSIVYAGVHFPFSGIPRDYDQAFQWLRRNTPKDSVVFTLNPEVDFLIPAFTENKVFTSCVIPNVSDFPMLQNTQRLLAGLSLLGADKERFLGKEGLFKTAFTERRELVAEGMVRGKVEKPYIYYLLFFLSPQPVARELLAKAAAAKIDLEPDYVWYGVMEKEFAPRPFPGKQGKLWREVYRNQGVALYRRERGPA